MTKKLNDNSISNVASNSSVLRENDFDPLFKKIRNLSARRGIPEEEAMQAFNLKWKARPPHGGSRRGAGRPIRDYVAEVGVGLSTLALAAAIELGLSGGSRSLISRLRAVIRRYRRVLHLSENSDRDEDKKIRQLANAAQDGLKNPSHVEHWIKDRKERRERRAVNN